jgi:hypothetical protein
VRDRQRSTTLPRLRQNGPTPRTSSPLRCRSAWIPRWNPISGLEIRRCQPRTDPTPRKVSPFDIRTSVPDRLPELRSQIGVLFRNVNRLRLPEEAHLKAIRHWPMPLVLLFRTVPGPCGISPLVIPDAMHAGNGPFPAKLTPVSGLWRGSQPGEWSTVVSGVPGFQLWRLESIEFITLGILKYIE